MSLEDQYDQVREQMKSFLPTIAHITRWDEIWQEVERAFPKIDLAVAALSSLDRMEEEPYGYIFRWLDLFGDQKVYTVARFTFDQEPPARYAQLLFLLNKGGTWTRKKRLSFSEVPAALEELGLPPDGWSTGYGRQSQQGNQVAVENAD